MQDNKIVSFDEKVSKGRTNLPKSFSQFSELGKIPPQATKVEEAVLGALMLEKNALPEVLDILSPDAFYKEENKEIYKAITSLFEKQQPVDLLTVSNELRQTGKLDYVGGAYYLSELTNRVGSSANIEFHARMIVEKFILRELIRISSFIQSEAYDETTDVFNLLDEAERLLYNISQGNFNNNYAQMSTLISQSLKDIEERNKKSKQEGVSGVPSGFRDLDYTTAGWQNSDLIIIASRPGMGKTSFVLSMARNMAVGADYPVAIFSLEMASIQLVNRLLSAEAELDSKKLRNGDLEPHEWQQLHTRIDKLSDAKIFIDDTPAINIFQLRAKCRRLCAQHGVKVVIVDYLQLMNAHTDNRKNINREQEISSISRALKGMAKELNIPVIALSQLSREVEKRGSAKRPILSDLRESGSIEQDADQVLFIYRPEYYFEQQDDSEEYNGLAEIIIAKNRHGPTRKVQLKFIENFAKFVNWDEYDFDNHGNGTITKPSKLNNDETTPF
jgi:replicative DNA helicase